MNDNPCYLITSAVGIEAKSDIFLRLVNIKHDQILQSCDFFYFQRKNQAFGVCRTENAPVYWTPAFSVLSICLTPQLMILRLGYSRAFILCLLSSFLTPRPLLRSIIVLSEQLFSAFDPQLPHFVPFEQLFCAADPQPPHFVPFEQLCCAADVSSPHIPVFQRLSASMRSQRPLFKPKRGSSGRSRPENPLWVCLERSIDCLELYSGTSVREIHRKAVSCVHKAFSVHLQSKQPVRTSLNT